MAEAGFSTSRRGFNQDEVRAFLTSVAAELGRLQERERQLEAELAAAETAVAPRPELDDAMVAELVGEETLHVLQTARESASQIKVRAEESAAKILRDANDEVNRVRQEAEVEAARKRHDATSDAEAEVALAKQQGREMVNEARAYRERVLADLERRTKVARQQIEDLAHGRDRLLQVFERARLVAVDVTSELQAIESPDEFVNLSPTTGPLPIMVPASERPLDDTTRAIDTPAADADADADATTEMNGADPDDSDVDIADVDLADVDVSDADDTDDTDEMAADDVDEAPVAAAPKPARDANVVSLFRDRAPDDVASDAEAPDDDASDDDLVDIVDDAAAEPAAAETADDETDDDDGDDDGDATVAAERPDVGGIFERLRQEAPAAATDDETAAEPSEGAATTDAAGVTADAESTPFSRRDEALVPLIVSGARKLKRVLADEQNGVLDLLRQKSPVTQLDELIPELDEHVQTYADALADDLTEAAVAGAAEVGKSDTKTLRTTILKGALDPAHAIVRNDLVGPLRARIERAIIDGAGDNEDITKRVRAVYREWKTQHIDHQLDDAFRFAHGGGAAVGVKPGTAIRWIIDPSEPTCADCEDNSLAGDVAAGEAFPTGHTAAPAHAGCRCLTVPTGQ